MAFVSSRRSTLNPDAPLFVPAAFRQVEDFSLEWWQLVTNSTWYHDYWLSKQQEEDGFCENDDDIDNLADLLPDSFDVDVDADEDFLSMDAQYEEFIRFGTEELKPTLSNTNAVHKNGIDSPPQWFEILVTSAMNEAMKKNMHGMTSFQRGVQRAAAEPVKYAEKGICIEASESKVQPLFHPTTTLKRNEVATKEYAVQAS